MRCSHVSTVVFLRCWHHPEVKAAVRKTRSPAIDKAIWHVMSRGKSDTTGGSTTERLSGNALYTSKCVPFHTSLDFECVLSHVSDKRLLTACYMSK